MKTSKQRSDIMRAVPRKDTVPELRVRHCAHRLGLRYRLHRKDLPGTPDLVFPKHRTVIFVHGCFWHRHEGCRLTTTPHTNRPFWDAKFRANVERDSRKTEQLERAGWRVFVIWECETKDERRLRNILIRIFHLNFNRRHSPSHA